MLQNRLFCLRTYFSALEGKECLKSSRRCLSVTYDVWTVSRKVGFANSALQKAAVFVVFAHFSPRELPPGASRLEPQHLTSIWSTRRELMNATPRSSDKNDAEKAVFRPFPECAIIDILKGKTQDCLHTHFFLTKLNIDITLFIISGLAV